MQKIILIGLKDLKISFRDRAALLLMLLAPFLLTLGLGLVTGRFSGTGSGIANIHVILVNQDQGQLGNALVDVFNSPELAGLVKPEASDNPVAARRLIDDDKATALVIIPKGFTDSIIPLLRGLSPCRGLIQRVKTPSSKSKSTPTRSAPPKRASSKPL